MKNNHPFRIHTPEEMDSFPGRELKEKRTRSSKTYSLGNGRFQAVIYPEPVHYQNEKGEWEDIDHSFSSDNHSLLDHSGDLSVQLAPGGCVTLRKGEYSLAWEISGAQPVEAQSENDVLEFPRHDRKRRIENRATYHELFPGVDFSCRILPHQFKDILIFKSPEALRPVDFILRAPGLLLSQNEAGEVVALADDEEIFHLPLPCVMHENGELIPNSATAALTQIEPGIWKWRCQVHADYAAHSTFPILLDPVVKTAQTGTAMSMAYTSSKRPTTAYPVTGYSTKVAYNDYSLGKCDTYLRFEPSALPVIDSSYYITDAVLALRTAESGSSVAVFLKEVLGSWNASSLTYNTRPAVAAYPLAFANAPSPSGVYMYYNIANLVRKWYTGENNGMMLETQGGGMIQLGGAGATYHKPYVTINYMSFAGLESYLAHESHSCGRAGTAHVSLCNGNLVVSQQETQMNGNLMPVSISRFYNSCYSSLNHFGAGNGWNLSIQQTLHKETISSTTYYVYQDGDGTRHDFKKESSKWIDQSGLSLKLTISGSTATITDKEDNKLVFDLPTAEFSNNYANAKLLKSMSDALGNTITISASGKLPTSVTDGAGRVTTCTFSSGVLTAVTAPGMPAISHGYSGAYLTSITHEDGKVSSYTYNSLGLLETIKHHDGTSLKIEYYTARTPYRVKQVSYLADGVPYAGRLYEYGDCRTTVIDLYPNSSNVLTHGKKLIYHFNDAGNVVSVNDELGYGCFAGYSSNAPTNHPDYVSRMQRAVNNLLRNHDFLTPDVAWSNDLMDGTGSCGYNSDNNYSGGRAYLLKKTSASGRISVYQSVSVTKGQEYTLSCYYQTTGNAQVQLRAEWTNSAGTIQYAESTAAVSTDRWDRASVTFTVPSNAASTSVKVRLMAAGGAGSVWLDAVQLEDGPVPNRYNMLENGAFSLNSSGVPTCWEASSDVTSSDCVITTPTGSRPSSLYGNVLRVNGFPGLVKEFQQYAYYGGARGDTFVAGGWSMNYCSPRHDSDGVLYELQVIARPHASEFEPGGVLQDDSYTTVPAFRCVSTVRWSEEWTGWQFAAIPVVMPWKYSEVGVKIVYRNNLNYAEFSNLFLHKEEFGSTFQYDANANVTQRKDAHALCSNSTYDSYNNIINVTLPGRSEVYAMHWSDTEEKKKEHLLRKTTSPLGIVQHTVYDKDVSSDTNPKGLPVESRVENTAGSLFMKSTTTYTPNKNYVASQTDARGKTVTTVTDANKGTVTSVTDPNDQTVSYTYDTMKRTTAVTATADGKTYKNTYTYSEDKLTQVAHNTTSDSSCDVVYNFAYDAQNRPTTVSVGGHTLSTNVYNTTKGNPLYGTLSQVNFGNGGKIINTYDDYKRVTGVRFDSDTSDRYTYAFAANGQVAKVKDNLLNRSAMSEYDVANRPMRITHTENGAHLYTGQVLYDNYNNLKTFLEHVGAGKTVFRTDFSYDVENRPTLLTFGDTNNKVAYAYDGIGRISSKTVTVGGRAYASSYAYVAGGHGTGSTTSLIASISQPNEAFSYTYDNVGNIASVTQNGKLTSYTYDKLGQLTRVNDQNDTTSGSSGTTWVYTYDRGGNILSKTRYAYTTGTLGTALQTIPYEYDDTWKDKLVKYNGVSISYDAIGNPTSDGTWTYTWEKGRQLKQMTKSGTTATFAYNADGLRIRKTVGSTVTNYTLHGKNIVHMTQGSNTLHFWYDASNKPAIVQFNGTKYAYLHNLQGDIVGIVDSAGNEVVKYIYDPWGKILSTSGSLASTLGIIQPFRYRGYVYDEETGLYYLRSRYYSPNWNRFVNADIIFCGNLFCYCDNSPIVCIDPNGFAKTPGAGWQPVGNDPINKKSYNDWYFRIDNHPFFDYPHIHLAQFQRGHIVQQFMIKSNGELHEDSPQLTPLAKEILENGSKVKKKWPPQTPGNSGGGTLGKFDKKGTNKSNVTSFHEISFDDAINGVNQSRGIALAHSIPFSNSPVRNLNGSYTPTAYQATSFALPDFSFILNMFSISENDQILTVCIDMP